MKKLLLCFLNRNSYTDELKKIAHTNKYLKNIFLGAFPADELTTLPIKRPVCWIWNTDEKTHDGQHWIGIWLTDTTMFFFDSFGLTPSDYLRDYWYDLAKKIHVNFNIVQKTRYQSKETYTCGMWCLLYLIKKAKKQQLPVNNNHKILNDIRLKKKIDNIFGVIINKIYKRKCKKRENQRACCFNDIFNKNLKKYLQVVYYCLFIWKYICSNTRVTIAIRTVIK